MTVFDTSMRLIFVRAAYENHLLFLFDADANEIRIKKGGVTYLIKVDDLVAFAKTSERVTFRAQLAVEDSNEEPVRGRFE